MKNTSWSFVVNAFVKGDGAKRLVDATAGGQVVMAIAISPIARELERNVTELRAPRHISFRVRATTYDALLTPDLEAGGYTVTVPALPGVITEADTIAEARRWVTDAARLWLNAQDRTHPKRAIG